MDLSIIVVNYNTKELLRQTIQSIIDTAGEPCKNNNEVESFMYKPGQPLQYEIFVSDNGSKDGSIEMIKECFKEVKLIENNANIGFAKANNIAIKQSTGRYVLILNSDTVIKEHCLQKCIAYMDKHKDIGTLGCKLLLTDGNLDRACKRGYPTPEASLYYMLKLHKLFPQSKKFGAYQLNYLSDDEINEVDSLVGAFMIVSKEVCDKVGLLDETFFMYGEDIDWCYRIKEAGFKVVYYPKAFIIHHKRASSKKKRIKTIYEFHRAMYIFYNKHYKKKYNILVTGAVYLGIALKLILTYMVNIFKK